MVESCTICGEELPDWRARLDNVNSCGECGAPRCRSCGIDVTDFRHTTNGGMCKACAPPGW